MTGALQDFQAGTMTLGALIDKVEGILHVIGDEVFRAETFGESVALEELYARTRIGDLDYENDGKPVVDRAVRGLLEKARAFSAVQH